MLNRLAEIKEDDGPSEVAIDIENNENEAIKKFGKHMEEYFAEVRAIKDSVFSLKTNIEKLTQEHSQYLSSTTANQNRAIKQRIGRLVDETRDHVKAVKAKLDNMNNNTKKLKDEKGNAASSEIRIREQQYYYLMKDFVAMLQQYQTIQDQFKNDSEDRMVRQIKIAKEDVSEDEIQQLLQQKELNVFKQVLTGSQKSTIEAVHAEVLETYNDVVELAEQFRELHELFVDFAALVAEQDELVDIISTNVERAADHVETGIENVKQAKVYQSRGRNVSCIILIVVIIIAIIAVLVVIALGTGLGVYFGAFFKKGI